MRLSQILINVIGNAVKFTPMGGKIDVQVIQYTSLGHAVANYEFRVKDNGIGIAPEFMDKLFLPFEREKTSTVSRIRGTGLGLALTKKIVDMMNGTIEVQSRVSEGSLFVIRLPFQVRNGEEAPENEKKGETEKCPEGHGDVNLKGKRILLVEDNELNREIARILFTESGLIVEEAEDGEVALKMLKEAPEPFDCVVMDIQMPHMNGYNATKAIRQLKDERLSGIPIIGMSANAFEEDKRKSFAMGMNAHLAKPINIDEVLNTIEKLLHSRS